MKLTIASAFLAIFLLPLNGTNIANAQSRLANGNCFTYALNNYSCTAWDVTVRTAGRYTGVLNATEYHPDNMNIAMTRIFQINDGKFILEERLNNNWSQVPVSFFLDEADQNCIMADWENVFCFRAF